MPNCSLDRTFGQSGTLWSEMPTPPGTQDPDPLYVGGNLDAAWSMGQRPRPVLLVSSWDPGFPGGVNWRALRVVAFPQDGRPAEIGRNSGTSSPYLSDLTVNCEYLDSTRLGPESLAILLRQSSGSPGGWTYLLRKATLWLGSVVNVQWSDVSVQRAWLHEPSDVPPMGNARVQVNPADPTQVVLVSTRGRALRVTALTMSQTVQSSTLDLASVLPGASDPFVRLRVESVRFIGGGLSIAMTGWRAAGRSQGLIFRVVLAGGAVATDSGYGTNGLWQSSLGDYPQFRAVGERPPALVGTAGSKLVAFGVRADGQDLDPGFGTGGVCELELGGSLRDAAVAGEDRAGWAYLFAQRQDGATVGARIRITTAQSPPAPHGTIDPTFGTNGIVTLQVDGYSTRPAGLMFPDQIHVDVGLARALSAGTRAVGVARHMLANGSLDLSFGSGGVARHEGLASAVQFDPAGRCVYATSRQSDNSLTLSWLDDQGRFGRAATVAHRVATSQVSSLALHPDGSIWVAGTGASAWVGRITASGALDSSFGTGGFAALRSSEGSGSAFLIGFRPDGTAAVLVWTQSGYVCALSPTGQPDPGYGQAGFAPLPSHATVVSRSGYTARADGSVILVTSTEHDPRSFGSPLVHMGLVRVRPDGTLDSSFGLGSQSPTQAPAARRCVVTLPFSNKGSSEVMECTVAPIVEQGGQLYAVGAAFAGAGRGGQFTFPVDPFLLVTRWNPDGTVDGAYGTGGGAIHGYQDDGSLWLSWSCTAAVREPSGEITLAGTVEGQPAIWQLRPSGALSRMGACTAGLQEARVKRALALRSLPGGKARAAYPVGAVQWNLTPSPFEYFEDLVEFAAIRFSRIVRALATRTPWSWITAVARRRWHA